MRHSVDKPEPAVAICDFSSKDGAPTKQRDISLDHQLNDFGNTVNDEQQTFDTAISISNAANIDR